MLQTRSLHQISVPEALQVLLESELLHRQQRKVVRLNKAAQFRYAAKQWPRLPIYSIVVWTKNTTRVYLLGRIHQRRKCCAHYRTHGSGKSYVASALGNHGVATQGHKVSYHNMQKLFAYGLPLAR